MTPDEKKLAEKGKRLWKNYRWTLAMRDALLKEQDGKCAICGRPENPDAPLNVDHFHFKVNAKRSDTPSRPDLKWWAVTYLGPIIISQFGTTKTEAIAKVREIALPLSVRGLLCPGRYTGCNRLLGRVDKPQWLRASANYLDNPPARKIIDKSTVI